MVRWDHKANSRSTVSNRDPTHIWTTDTSSTNSLHTHSDLPVSPVWFWPSLLWAGSRKGQSQITRRHTFIMSTFISTAQTEVSASIILQKVKQLLNNLLMIFVQRLQLKIQTSSPMMHLSSDVSSDPSEGVTYDPASGPALLPYFICLTSDICS